MKVLIALNITAQSREIVNEAASRPWPAGTVFLVLHVLDPFPFAKAPISLKRAKEAAAVQLKSAATRLSEAGWKTETDVVVGMPRRVVSEVAASWRADLIMVGSNDAGALMRLFLGSTARSVLRHAPCSVEIVRPTVQDNEQGRVSRDENTGGYGWVGVFDGGDSVRGKPSMAERKRGQGDLDSRTLHAAW